MKNGSLLTPEDIKARLKKRFVHQHTRWLAKQGQWPLTLSLHPPDEKTALSQLPQVGHWITQWRTWSQPHQITWKTRQWATLGKQIIPTKITLSTPEAVANIIHQLTPWQTAQQRYQQMTTRWPTLKKTLHKHYASLSQYTNPDFNQLIAVITWIEQHPHSQLYLRQLPIPHIDTKWIETRQTLIRDLIASLRNLTTTDFYTITGLKAPPETVRLRILDPHLSQKIGGLNDLSVPINDLNKLPFTPQRVIIVENLQTGLAFPPQPGTIVFMGLGYGVSGLHRLPWLHHIDCYYWGDLDTHGFGILNQIRRHFPHIQSRLMDKATLMRFQALWGKEPSPLKTKALPHLTPQEFALYQGIRDNHWGQHLRLEQERIHWSCVDF